MKKAIYYLGLFSITLMLFILHSAFSYMIMPMFLAEDFFELLFEFSGYDVKIWFPYVFGAAFAFAISSIMSLLQKTDPRFWQFAKTVAILEFIGIALIVYPKHGFFWLILSGLYYGSYLLTAIIFYFYIKPDNENSQKNAKKDSRENRANAKNENDEKVMQMIKSGIDLKLISEDLNINLSTVYRIKKKYENEH